MAYTKTNWSNGETALSDVNFNHMETGIKDAHDLIDALKAVGSEFILSLFPVGTIVSNATGTNPGTYIGGTWEEWGSGRVPVGVDTTQTEFATAEHTGGEKTVTLSSAQIPAHHHSYVHRPGSSVSGLKKGTGGTIEPLMSYVGNTTGATGDVGSGQAHNNLPPYVTCYFFKRTA